MGIDTAKLKTKAQLIAARYGLRRDSVNQSLCRTRKKLKAHLIQEGYAV